MVITNTFYNNTDNNESLTLDAVFSLSGSSGYRRDLTGKLIKTEADTKWIEATDYDRIETKQPIAPDGFRKGEDRENLNEILAIFSISVLNNIFPFIVGRIK